MGRPKQLLEIAGRTILSRTVDALRTCADEVVLIGSGPVPVDLCDMVRLTDVPNVGGPLAGILAAMRWAPHTRWLIAGCDYPRIRSEALRWLLDQGRPDTWAVMPRRSVGARPEPLLALYEPQSELLLARLAVAGGGRGPADLVGHPRVSLPGVPVEFQDSWEDIDHPDEFAKVMEEK
jgi:glutamate dehydrogenase (NADP+)/cyclic pyranopterin phosphate synthase/molybdopterin-guanine dinucleotide biosynthesis protein A